MGGGNTVNNGDFFDIPAPHLVPLPLGEETFSWAENMCLRLSTLPTTIIKENAVFSPLQWERSALLRRVRGWDFDLEHLNYYSPPFMQVLKHKQKISSRFSAKYNCDKLVWFETHETRVSAFTRERQMKKWNRAWKIRRIETDNPDWLDLYEGLTTDQVFHFDRQYEAEKL